jgi:hypothetical protein
MQVFRVWDRPKHLFYSNRLKQNKHGCFIRASARLGFLFAPQAPASVKNELFFSLLKTLVFNTSF